MYHPINFNRSSSISSFDSSENEKVQAIRTSMTTLLEERLIKSNNKNNDNKNKVNSKVIAKRVEQLLFQSSPSLYAYQDKHTLDDRIRSVVTAIIVQRRFQQHHSSTSKSTTTSEKTNNSNTVPPSKQNNIGIQKQRTYILLKTLGKENYFKAKALVQEIKLCKNQKVATMKCTPGGVCTRPFRGSFPPVIRDLFFATPLLDAFERSPLESITSERTNWTELIANAEENLQAYKKWSNNN